MKERSGKDDQSSTACADAYSRFPEDDAMFAIGLMDGTHRDWDVNKEA